MIRFLRPALLAVLLLLLPGLVRADDVAEARAVFERNLQAIRDKNPEAYIDCYWQSADLVRNGPAGPAYGFDELAASAGSGWPTVFDAVDLRLTPIRPGVVYGSYRYRVVFGEDESTGISERLFVETPRGWKIAVTTAYPAPPGTPPPPLALAGGTVVGPDSTVHEDATVLIRNGEIEAVGPRAATPVPDGYEWVDATGLFLVPGLIDAHVHLSQTGWADGRPDILDVRDAYPYETVMAEVRENPQPVYDAYLASGVTAVLDAGGYPWTVDRARGTDSDLQAPHVAAAGPVLTTLDHGLNLPGEKQFLYLENEATAREAVHYLHSLGAAAVTVWFLPVPDDRFVAMERRVEVVAREAESLGMPLLVHTTTLREARVAVETGARMLLHSITDAEVDSAFAADMAARGTLYCPTLTVTAGYLELFAAATDGRAPVIDDPRGCVDAALAERIARTGEVAKGRGSAHLEDLRERLAADQFTARTNLLRLLEAGVPVVLGTDAGSPLTLHGFSVFGELEALQGAGLSPQQVLDAATLHAAGALGRDDLGRLVPGAAGDVLVLEANPLEDAANYRRIRAVVRGGEYRAAGEACP